MGFGGETKELRMALIKACAVPFKPTRMQRQDSPRLYCCKSSVMDNVVMSTSKV